MTLEFAHIMNRANVRMVQGEGGARLPLEAYTQCPFVQGFRQQLTVIATSRYSRESRAL